jgi:hypothetical protein
LKGFAEAAFPAICIRAKQNAAAASAIVFFSFMKTVLENNKSFFQPVAGRILTARACSWRTGYLFNAPEPPAAPEPHLSINYHPARVQNQLLTPPAGS